MSRLVAALGFATAVGFGCGGGQDSGVAKPGAGAGGDPVEGPADVEPEKPLSPNEQLLERHLKALDDRDIDALMADYTEDSYLFHMSGATQGLPGPKSLHEQFFGWFAEPGAERTVHRKVVVGDVAYFVWSGKTAELEFPVATETLLLRDGKITYHTLALQIVNKDTGPVEYMSWSLPDKYEPNSAAAVLVHHMNAFKAGDMDALMSDYTAGSTLITPEGELVGPDAIAPVLKKVMAEFQKPGAKLTLHRVQPVGEVAYIFWSAKTPDNIYEIGTDTFVIRDGKIVTQTFAAKTSPPPPPKPKKPEPPPKPKKPEEPWDKDGVNDAFDKLVKTCKKRKYKQALALMKGVADAAAAKKHCKELTSIKGGDAGWIVGSYNVDDDKTPPEHILSIAVMWRTGTAESGPDIRFVRDGKKYLFVGFDAPEY